MEAYRRAEVKALDLKQFKHDYLPIDPKVKEAIEPIYKGLRGLLNKSVTLK